MDDRLLLTVDYELFGGGGGSCAACMVEPLERMARIAEAHDTPLTVFVEVSEIMAMEAWDETREQARAIRAQLVDLVRRGHDLQLHVHPQWMWASRNHGAWTLDLSLRRVGDLSPSDAREHLTAAAGWLTELAQSATPAWRLTAFRAGGWTIQPGAAALEVLAELGVRVESSVVPGLFETGVPDWYDFRTAPTDRSWWRFDEDVCAVGSGPWLQLPIASADIGWRAGLRGLLSRNLRGRPRAPGCSDDASGSFRSRRAVARGAMARLRSASVAKLDFCNLESHQLAQVCQRWVAERGPGPHPIVAIGHTKTFGEHAEIALATWLTWCRAEGIRPATYASWLDAADLGS